MVKAVVAEVSHQGPVPEDMSASCTVSQAAVHESINKGTSPAEAHSSRREVRQAVLWKKVSEGG